MPTKTVAKNSQQHRQVSRAFYLTNNAKTIRVCGNFFSAKLLTSKFAVSRSISLSTAGLLASALSLMGVDDMLHQTKQRTGN